MELNFYENKKVLVTGGASFIGSHLVDKLVSLKSNVTVVDDLSSGRLENLSNVIDKIKFVKEILNMQVFKDLRKFSKEMKSFFI